MPSGQNEKTRILFLSANPVDNPPLTVDQEFIKIYDKLRMVEFREDFILSMQPAISIPRLQQVLLETKPQIVHFSGHGSNANALKFENSDGKAEIVPPAALAEIFRYLDGIRLVILNACYSVPQAQTISKHVDRVTGTSTAVYDEAAREFAVYFYQALGYGKSVEDAFELAKIQLRLFKIPEDQMPTLLKREGTEASKVFFRKSTKPGTEIKTDNAIGGLSNLQDDIEDLRESYSKVLTLELTLDEFWEKMRSTLLKLTRSGKDIGRRNAESLNLNLINLATIFGDYRTRTEIGDNQGAAVQRNQLMMVSNKVLDKLEELSSSFGLPPSD
jgi:hypothetical protein